MLTWSHCASNIFRISPRYLIHPYSSQNYHQSKFYQCKIDICQAFQLIFLLGSFQMLIITHEASVHCDLAIFLLILAVQCCLWKSKYSFLKHLDLLFSNQWKNLQFLRHRFLISQILVFRTKLQQRCFLQHVCYKEYQITKVGTYLKVIQSYISSVCACYLHEKTNMQYLFTLNVCSLKESFFKRTDIEGKIF